MDYFVVPEVSHDRSKFLVIHVYYVVDSEDFHDRTIFLVINVYYVVVYITSSSPMILTTRSCFS